MSRTKLKSHPKSILVYPKIYRDTLAYWCTFRNLGFSADEIFFGFGTVDGQSDMVHLQLQTQGKTFTVTVGELRKPRQQVLDTWKQFATLAQQSTQEERNACYRSHLIGESKEYFTAFVQGILMKGIVVPEIAQYSPDATNA
jgi:hypothetical protein